MDPNAGQKTKPVKLSITPGPKGGLKSGSYPGGRNRKEYRDYMKKLLTKSTTGYQINTKPNNFNRKRIQHDSRMFNLLGRAVAHG